MRINLRSSGGSKELLAVGLLGAGSGIADRVETLLRRGRSFSPRTSRRRLLSGIALLSALTAAASLTPDWLAFAQPPPRLQFETASVRQSPGDERQQSWEFLPGGRYTATSITLKWLLLTAWDLSMSPDQLAGGPGWMDTDRYDIQAKAEDGALSPGTPARLREEKTRMMLQTLIEDRFKLAFHREQREAPVYALVVAKNGPRLRKSKTPEADCAGPVENSAVCHGFSGGQTSGLNGRAVDMSDLAYVLSAFVHRPVLDKTGIKGLFDIRTDGWSPLVPVAAGPAADGNNEHAADTGATLFTVLQEQLGLKLESSRGPVEVLVIDHAEKPDAN